MSDPEAASRFLASLRRTQWLEPQSLAAYQRPLIERLVRHAATKTAFYPDRLAPLFAGGDPAAAPIDLSRWHAVPVLKRSHVIDHLDAMTARETPPDTGEGVPGATSGTTGRRVEHLRSRISRMAENCALNRVYEIFDMDLAGVFAFVTTDRDKTHQYPDGQKYRGWNLTERDALMHVIAVATLSPDLLEWFERVRPDHISCYPSRMAEVAELAVRNRSPFRFKTLIASGEPLDPVSAEKIVDAFGCEIIDVYSAREVGVMAFECPDAAGYHVPAEMTLVEVLDDDGLPAPPGEFGHVVVTSLYNYAMPFIRYDIGDFAVAGAQVCRCGRGLPKLDRIGGRSRAAFVWPDGSRRQFSRPIVVDIAKYLSFREVQVVQTELNAIEIRYVPHEEGPPPDIAGLTALFRQFFSPAATVRLTPLQRLPRTAGMKLEQFLSLVDD